MYTEGFGCTPIMLICFIYGPPACRKHLPKQFNKCKYQGRVVNVELICTVPTLLLSNVMGYKSWQLCCPPFTTFHLLFKSPVYSYKLLAWLCVLESQKAGTLGSQHQWASLMEKGPHGSLTSPSDTLYSTLGFTVCCNNWSCGRGFLHTRHFTI